GKSGTSGRGINTIRFGLGKVQGASDTGGHLPSLYSVLPGHLCYVENYYNLQVWSALKPNRVKKNPIHEMDLLSSQKNDVNYACGGCSVASKI
ncbi:hypothetical protein VIGAN_09155000, partial [Vigna angularis var. angularis]